VPVLRIPLIIPLFSILRLQVVARGGWGLTLWSSCRARESPGCPCAQALSLLSSKCFGIHSFLRAVTFDFFHSHAKVYLLSFAIRGRFIGEPGSFEPLGGLFSFAFIACDRNTVAVECGDDVERGAQRVESELFLMAADVKMDTISDLVNEMNGSEPCDGI